MKTVKTSIGTVRRNTVKARLILFSLLAIALIVCSFFSEYLTPHDPYLQNLDIAKQAPTKAHPLGTDRYGRDMLSRVIVGSRTSIFSTLLLVAAVTVLGTAVGLCGGFFGGWADAVLMRVSDIFLAFPGLVFALAVGLVQIVVGMAVKFWMLCRRGQVVDAVLDIGTWWVIFVGIALFALGVGNVAGYPVVLIIGCLMLLGQARNAKGFGRVTAVIGAVYNGVTGYFGDILSYSRLMVMMLAGSVIGQVFNILGAMPGGGLPPAIGIPIFFLIFIIGHAFNIGLNVIGTYVHTSRLQYLEFFKQFYEEGGRPWRPLNIATKYVDIKEEQ